ncbi:uncharacterized protein DFL_003168 [Arthrobotrys flagrans]|uniref:Uncharacterized protein n=1 Tax=Arthrobotrys flagrans TaxID=97331 RepID=A0A437A120_ARTFL|nr:hypothetical protein DFL_003168 [Arthrobotrys flagrans]
MNNTAFAPVVMLLMMLNQYIDLVTQSILNILYSFTASIPLLTPLLWPIRLILRLRIHLAPQKSFFGGILGPLKLGGCENVTGAVAAVWSVYWLYGNCRPFRRVVGNVRRRGRRVWICLKRLDFVGVVGAVVRGPDATGGRAHGPGFRVQSKR